MLSDKTKESFLGPLQPPELPSFPVISPQDGTVCFKHPPAPPDSSHCWAGPRLWVLLPVVSVPVSTMKECGHPKPRPGASGAEEPRTQPQACASLAPKPKSARARSCVTNPSASCRGHRRNSRGHPLTASKEHIEKKSLPQGHWAPPPPLGIQMVSPRRK